MFVLDLPLAIDEPVVYLPAGLAYRGTVLAWYWQDGVSHIHRSPRQAAWRDMATLSLQTSAVSTCVTYAQL